MYSIILQLHHYIAFIAFGLLAFAAINGIMGTTSEKVFEESNRKINVFALISTHVMLLLGIALLLVSPNAQAAYADMAATMKDSYLRRTFIEHPTTNIIAVVLATIGNAKSKRAIGHGKKFKTSAIFFGIAFVLVALMMPWSRLFAF